MLNNSEQQLARHALNMLSSQIYAANVRAGWYKNPQTGRKIDRNIPEMIALIHSELSEGLEGFRKNLMDDHLPTRKMLEVELADTLIRIFDLAGYQGLDLGGALIEKMEYNAVRADHKLENRVKPGGKSC